MPALRSRSGMGVYLSTPHSYSYSCSTIHSNSPSGSRSKKALVRKKTGRMQSAREFSPISGAYYYHDPYSRNSCGFYPVPPSPRRHQEEQHRSSSNNRRSSSAPFCHPHHIAEHGQAPYSTTVMSRPNARTSSLVFGPDEPQVSFRGAARRLNNALHNALDHFQSFHSLFRQTTKSINWTSQDMVDGLWKTRISWAEEHPGRAEAALNQFRSETQNQNQSGSTHASSRKNKYDYSNDDDDDNNNNNQNGQEDHSTTEFDHLTFNELRELLKVRLNALCHARVPNAMPGSTTAAGVPPASNNDNIRGENLMGFSQREAAVALKKKVKQCQEDVFELMAHIKESPLQMRNAIRELRALATHMETYNIAWAEGTIIAEKEDEIES